MYQKTVNDRNGSQVGRFAVGRDYVVHRFIQFAVLFVWNDCLLSEWNKYKKLHKLDDNFIWEFMHNMYNFRFNFQALDLW